MGNTVPFYNKAVCDGCGVTGAYDFMGDCFCQKCLDAMPAGETEHRFGDAPPCPGCAEIERLRAENEDLRLTAMAFVAVAAAQDARVWGLPDGHLLAHHYDRLASLGARMDSFTRSEHGQRVAAPQPVEPR